MAFAILRNFEHWHILRCTTDSCRCRHIVERAHIDQDSCVIRLARSVGHSLYSDGAMLLPKCRGLSVREYRGQIQRLFGTSGSAVVANDLFCQGQSGMLGVSVDPDFAGNRFLYLFMASNLNDRKTNRVVRLIVDAGYTTVSNRKDIITDIPFKSSATIWGGAGAHSGDGFGTPHPTDTFISPPATTTTGHCPRILSA